MPTPFNFVSPLGNTSLPHPQASEQVELAAELERKLAELQKVLKQKEREAQDQARELSDRRSELEAKAEQVQQLERKLQSLEEVGVCAGMEGSPTRHPINSPDGEWLDIHA